VDIHQICQFGTGDQIALSGNFIRDARVSTGCGVESPSISRGNLASRGRGGAGESIMVIFEAETRLCLLEIIVGMVSESDTATGSWESRLIRQN